jgi:hypothetical protein
MSVAIEHLHDDQRPDPVDPADAPGGWHGEFLTDADTMTGTARVRLPGYSLDADFEAQGIVPHDVTWPVTGDSCCCVIDDEQFCWVVAWRSA